MTQTIVLTFNTSSTCILRARIVHILITKKKSPHFDFGKHTILKKYWELLNNFASNNKNKQMALKQNCCKKIINVHFKKKIVCFLQLCQCNIKIKVLRKHTHIQMNSKTNQTKQKNKNSKNICPQMQVYKHKTLSRDTGHGT